MSAGGRLRALLNSGEPVVAPLALDPLTALMAVEQGFKALYVGGGALGYRTGVTEAALTPTDFQRLAVEIRSVCDVPLILDGACGWGDPMHLVSTVRRAEAAGFAAIEIEDQIFPKRVHHHVGIEHAISVEEMCDKIRVACDARTDGSLVIIARTNVAREPHEGVDGAAHRVEQFRAAGADLVMVYPTGPAQAEELARRVGGPLFMLLSGGVGAWPYSKQELQEMGYVMIADPTSTFYAATKAIGASLRSLADWQPDPFMEDVTRDVIPAIQQTIGLDDLLEIEKRTVEHDADA